MASLYGFPSAGCGGEVAGVASAKAKRKDLDEAYDDFSEFSLFSPARKIRRLDAEGIPLMETDEELAVPRGFGQPLPDEQPYLQDAEGIPLMETDEELAVPRGFGQPLPDEQLQNSLQEMAVSSLNEERAIVLYKPVHTSFVDSSPSSDIFLKVDPEVIAAFKNRGFWPGQSRKVEIREVEEEAPSCLAVVPWMPLQPTGGTAFPVGATGGSCEVAEEEMVAGDEGDASMDVEQEAARPAVAAAPSGDGMVGTQGFLHRQQHCSMMPHHRSAQATALL